ncbi:venom acid phosphatase Acph-1-like [Camponotus floridanus]|uniref:venom acid phosphatase Acph-1-like n=1 Tax=Camponotus floridanus TaxID=104421 RepID=UPI000DC68818|nr:venom acid phosphatase Acph-1-like [Camponotus floridanus]
MNATVLQYDLFSYGILKTLNGGPLLRKIINDMNAMINGTLKDRKLNLFSGHDINVAGIMYALNIFDEQVVRYTSSIMIELHEKNSEFFVKVVHYLGIPSTIIEKCIPGCKILCPYNKFIQLTSAVTATNEELKCS